MISESVELWNTDVWFLHIQQKYKIYPFQMYIKFTILITDFVVFKHIQQSFLTRRIRVWGNNINIIQIINLSRNFLLV